MTLNLPSLIIKNTKRFQSGHPWIYSNEILMNDITKQLPQGEKVMLKDAQERCLGVGYFNAHSLISVRVLSRTLDTINTQWVADRLESAAIIRDATIGVPFYRLIHSESDFLPGVIIDRYGDYFVVQLNTAGADALKDNIITALDLIFSPKHIIVRQDQPIRHLEGIEMISPPQKESILVEGIENDVHFLADITEGQKTGWFFDQRDNRRLLTAFVKDKSVLDCYSFTGSFALNAAKAGASHVTSIDRSQSALNIAEKNAALNHVKLTTLCSDAFKALQDMKNDHFDVVVIDPPAFVKTRKDFNAGMKGYTKLVNLAEKCVKKGGILLFTSCSHHVGLEDLRQTVQQGLKTRPARILKHLSAGMDHPTHPHLPETHYLKGFLLQLD